MLWAEKSSENASERLEQEYLVQFLDQTPRSIMYMENQGQHLSLNVLFKIGELLEISIDQFFFPARCSGDNEQRKHIDRPSNCMDERELTVMETVAEGIENQERRPIRYGPRSCALSKFFQHDFPLYLYLG